MEKNQLLPENARPSPGRQQQALLCSPLLQDIGWNQPCLISMSLVNMARATCTATLRGLSVASEGLLRSNILEEHQDALHAADGHIKVDVPEGVKLPIVIFRCRSTWSYRIARRLLYWLSIIRASSSRVTMSYSKDMPPMWYEASTSVWFTRL